jgi:transaldolase
MKFFIDTADVNEIRKAAAMGVLDGVTTNPSLVAKTGRPHREVLEEICSIVPGPVSAEVHGTSYDVMIREGRELAKIHDNIVVKFPTTLDGLRACKTARGEGIHVNMTLIFSPAQALLVAKAGATFASPFIGRLDDISQDGMKLIADVVQIYRNYGYKTEVLVASVRDPVHVVDAAKLGAHICTIPFNVIEKLIQHPLTDVGLKKFLADAEKIPKAG